MELAKESLLLKRQILERLMEKGLSPYSRFYLGDVYRRFGCYWANHFNTIGLISMNEALLNFAGCDLASARRALAQEVLNFMRGRLVDFRGDRANCFNLAQLRQKTSYRLAQLDKRRIL